MGSGERAQEQTSSERNDCEAAAGGPPGESRSDSEAARGDRRRAWLTPVSVAIGVCSLVALALRLLLLSRPGYLLGVTEYDDGHYFGSAVNLIHGSCRTGRSSWCSRPGSPC